MVSSAEGKEMKKLGEAEGQQWRTGMEGRGIQVKAGASPYITA